MTLDLDAAQVEAYQRRLREEETPDPEPLDVNELRSVWERGNARRPLPPNFSDNHKIDIVRTERKWKSFCNTLGIEDWKNEARTISHENRGLAEAFLLYLMRTSRQRKGKQIDAESTIRVYSRKLNGLVKKYTGQHPDKSLVNHLYDVAVSQITPTFGLRREPKQKPIMGPDLFTYHLYFLWVKDLSRFHIGLDRIDDVTIRQICMWTGCRKHELVYNKPPDRKVLLKEYEDESDAYTDVEYYPDESARPRRCWVCDDIDERTDPSFHVLCWEDIDLWILRDPENGSGRDRLAMQILLRWHKGHNKKIVPTWYLFVEEQHPGLCPISHILAKALAEKVIANHGYQTSADPFFSTKLSRRAVRIQWKKEWRHKPVFRRTVNALGEKTDEPLTAAVFDSHSNRLGIALGLSEKLSQYCYRRGYAETVDSNYRQSVRDQGMRHKPNSTVYQNYYHNARMNAVVQDAFLGRGTNSPMLALLNHMGLRRDENAPKAVSEHTMQIFGSNRTTRRLESEFSKFQAELTEKYGRPSRAPATEVASYYCKQQELRTARQKHRRKVLKVARRGYFEKKDDEELQNQLQGIHTSTKMQRNTHIPPERNDLAAIFGDFDDDLSEKEVVRRKIDAINAMVAYAFVHEPLVRAPRQGRQKPKSQTAIDSAMPRCAGRPLAPRRTMTGQNIRCLHATNEQPASPPPPYSAVDPRGTLKPDVIATKTNLSVSCIWCRKKYTRMAMLWNHLEAHLRLANGGPVECPECLSVSVSPTAFKAHAARDHGKSFRP